MSAWSGSLHALIPNASAWPCTLQQHMALPTYSNLYLDLSLFIEAGFWSDAAGGIGVAGAGVGVDATAGNAVKLPAQKRSI